MCEAANKLHVPSNQTLAIGLCRTDLSLWQCWMMIPGLPMFCWMFGVASSCIHDTRLHIALVCAFSCTKVSDAHFYDAVSHAVCAPLSTAQPLSEVGPCNGSSCGRIIRPPQQCPRGKALWRRLAAPRTRTFSNSESLTVFLVAQSCSKVK
jgi:hypothetical protein